MNIALSLPLADDGWGMHDGGDWWIVPAVLMMLFMGAMMWMMMRGMGGDSRGNASPPPDRPTATESPVEILERRFAEGEISLEDYRARRQVLAGATADRSGDRNSAPVSKPAERAGNGD